MLLKISKSFINDLAFFANIKSNIEELNKQVNKLGEQFVDIDKRVMRLEAFAEFAFRSRKVIELQG